MDRREFIQASGALAVSCSRISDAFGQASWTPPYTLPARGQVISLAAPGGNTLRSVATAANGWGDYTSMVAIAAPIWTGNGFGAFAADYSEAGAMVIAGNGGHHAGSIWGGFIFDFTTGQWISKANTNGKIETKADPVNTAVDWSTGELIDKTGLTGQLPIPGHGYVWPFCPPKSVSGGSKGVYIKPCVVAGSDAGYDAGRSFQFDLDTGLWTYASDNTISFDGKYTKPYTDGGGAWDPVTSRYYTPQKGYATGDLRYLEKTATGWTWRKAACPNLRNARFCTAFVHERDLVIGYTDLTWQKVNLDNIGAGASTLAMANASLVPPLYTRWHKYPVDGCWYALKGLSNRASITSWPSSASPTTTLAADQFLLKIDPTTWTVTQDPIAGGILAVWEYQYTPAHPPGNAFVYVPKLECFAWFPRPDAPIQLIKPSAGGTSGGDTQPPTVPPNLRTTTATTSSLTWAWDASIDNGGGTVAGYKVALYDSGGTALGSLVDAGNVLTYTASGLAASTTYKLAASAYDNAAPPNESALSAQVAGTTAAVPDTEPPSVPANLRVTTATANSISWGWDASTDSGGGSVAGYKVALQDAGGTQIGAVVDAGNTLTYTASGLNAGTTYRLAVSAYDNASPPNTSALCTPVAGTTSTASSDTQPPTVPTTLRVKKVTANSITWTWNASTDLGGGSVAGYKVALYDNAGSQIGGPVNAGNVLTYTAAGLAAESTYRLTVSAYDNAVPANESAPCAPVAGTTRKAPPGQG